MTTLHPSDYCRVRWKNDGGWTTQLASCPAAKRDDGPSFDWRISIAEIESDGEFSAFPGCDRHIALLDGVGMQLCFDQAADAELRERLRFVKFDGDWHTRACLLAGPVRDFNVIARRDAFTAQVLHRPLVGPMVFLAEANVTWFVYIADGSARRLNVDPEQELRSGDSMLLEPGAHTGTCVLDGGGELVVVKLTRVLR